jgi:hypothetical protein
VTLSTYIANTLRGAPNSASNVAINWARRELFGTTHWIHFTNMQIEQVSDFTVRSSR